MKVSVIISTYNRASLLKQAIDSVLEQTFKNYELIVVDDGSTDETYEIIKHYGDKIHYIRQNNSGLNASRNKALRVASGQYIALLDDDDLWKPYKLELQVKLMDLYPEVSYAFSDFHIFNISGIVHRQGLQTWFNSEQLWNEIYKKKVVCNKTDLNIKDLDDDFDIYLGSIYKHLLLAPFVLPSTSLIRRSAIPEKVRFIEEEPYGDWDFFARLTKEHHVMYIDHPTTLNRSHKEIKRITQAPPIIHCERRLALIRRVWKSDQEFYNEHRKAVDQIEDDLLLKQARYALQESRKAEALAALKEYRKDGSGNNTLAYLVLYMVAKIPGTLNLLNLLLYIRRLLHRKFTEI